MHELLKIDKRGKKKEKEKKLLLIPFIRNPFLCFTCENGSCAISFTQ